MPNPNDFGPIDARLNKPLSQYAKTATEQRPVSEYMASNPAMDFLQKRIMPRPPERVELNVGEIVLAVDVHQETYHRRSWFDLFDQSWKSGMETVYSGNGLLYWTAGGPEHLRSRFEWRRASCEAEDVARLFRDLPNGALPGMGITLDRENMRGRIVDLFGLKEYEELWEHLRRRSVQLSNPVWVGMPGVQKPGQEHVQTFKNRSELATWEWHMRNVMDAVIDTPAEKRHVVTDFQNARDIRTREDLVRSGLVKVQFPSEEMRFYVERDMLARKRACEAGKLVGSPSDYEFDGFLTPALAGLAEVDLATRMPGLRDSI